MFLNKGITGAREQEISTLFMVALQFSCHSSLFSFPVSIFVSRVTLYCYKQWHDFNKRLAQQTYFFNARTFSSN